MQICTVVGHVWATKKDPALQGAKLMIVNPAGQETQLVAADLVGAGIGERVLVVTGSTARAAFDQKPIDAAIVGIIDETDQD